MGTKDSDIVTRLDRWAIEAGSVPASDLMDEAAAEIERLNREVSVLVAECQRQKELLVNGATLTDAEQEATTAPLRVDRITLIVHHRNRDGLRFWASRLAESFACCERVSLPKGEDERERLSPPAT
jgi:hypothetical protein